MRHARGLVYQLAVVHRKQGYVQCNAGADREASPRTWVVWIVRDLALEMATVSRLPRARYAVRMLVIGGNNHHCHSEPFGAVQSLPGQTCLHWSDSPTPSEEQGLPIV